jgi:Family of unknown function (DUF6375)
MKVWTGYGSEHSYNLIMIGRFVDETSARIAEQKFERLREAAGEVDVGWDADQRFTDGIRAILDELRTWDLSRSDIENFAYDHTLKRKGNELHIETEEGEVQGFLKILIGEGARVEVYSAHDWTSERTPREAEAHSEQPMDG